MNDAVAGPVVEHPEFCVNRNIMTRNNSLDLPTASLYEYEDIMEIEYSNYGQDITDSEADQEMSLHRSEPGTVWRIDHPECCRPPTAKASVIEQLYADVVLPKVDDRKVPQIVQNTNKVTRSASVQDSGATLLFNRTLLLFSQLHIWIGSLFGLVLPATRSYASQIGPEAIISNLDIVITYLVRLLCCMYLQMKLLIQEEITRWFSVFLCAVWESLMRLSVYR